MSSLRMAEKAIRAQNSAAASRLERWTEPKDVALVASKLAEVRGITAAEVEASTTENVLRMLGERAAGISGG